MAASHPVTIVVPVYGDWPSLSECIAALKEHINHDVHRVMLVNDCGPDAELIEKSIKKSIKGHENFIYYRNPKNLGFIGNCNRAVLELDDTNNDILLLNSDTKVTAGFLEEMITALYSAEDIGAVSPRSNNATIATVPLSAAPQKGIESGKSYQIFQKIKNKLPRYVKVPVAHGFCMLIRRDLIKKYGLFDPIFGKGYGEEVDFCMRIKQKGYTSLLANRAYVFHLEARSFSLETKAKLLEENNKIVWSRWPKYRQSVREYMADAVARETAIEESVLGTRQSSRILIGKTKRHLMRYPVIRKLATRLRSNKK